MAGTYRVHVTAYNCIATTAAATLAYKLTPVPNMTYSSSTVVQSSTLTTTPCDFDQNVVCLQVVTAGSCSPLTLTRIQLGAGSSTSGTLADVSKIHVYYTGTTNTFNTTNEFVSGGTTPAGGTNTLNGSQVLASGTNYFWVAYDVNPAATIGNVIDASVTQFTVAASNKVPTVTNPAGTRAITACASYPGTKALGLQHWVKSDVGVTGTSSISAWSDQSSGTSITGNLVQATAANQPSLVVNAVNFQPYVRFNGTTDILVSANTFSGTALYNATNNTILMVKNYKSGTVDYKWENATSGASRVGFELNGSFERFDFVDDASGKNANSTTNIVNLDVIAGGITSSTNNDVRLNGNVDATNQGGLTFAPGTALNPLYIGSNDLGNPLYCNVDIAEAMTFNVTLGSSLLRRVETYLAIKYGITLGNNKGAGSSVTYMGSDGTQIWANQTGYHNNVIGIGRDNAAGNSGLNKLRSKSVVSLNPSADILTIANGANMGGAAFSVDKSFFITGNNGQSLPSSAASNADVPVGILSRLSRVWKGQETGTVAIMSLKFDLSSMPANNLANVRLLVNPTGVFASGTTIVSPSGYSNVTDTVVFQFDFTAVTGFYYTLGSVNLSTTPLPITLTAFTADCFSDGIHVNWQTASEINCADFELQRSTNGIDYTTITTLQGHGTTTSQNNYAYLDPVRAGTIYYYRLKQNDYSGQYSLYPAAVSANSSCMTKNDGISVFPNPANDQISIKLSAEGPVSIDIISDIGQLVYASTGEMGGQDQINIQTSGFANGVYAVRVSDSYKTIVKKITIAH